jgi:glycosyltransferase involved in cell wall biosynthesis
MKIIMLGRIGLLEVGGGDKVQVENTAKELRKLGVEVDISTDLNADLTKYDLVHIFQLDWYAEAYLHAKNAKSCNKPIVLSPIHHSMKEVKKYDDDYAFGFRRVSKILFKDQFKRDTFKNLYRSFFDYRKIRPTLLSVVKGLKNLHTETLKMADVVFVQTGLEAKDLVETYGVPIKWEMIPNGVGENFINRENFTNGLGIENYILCVGRIEPRKNQLSIIKAVDHLREITGENLKVVFIGVKSIQKHKEYVGKFDQALKEYPWVLHIEKVPYEEIPTYYHFAKVCVSASWFETTGLTSLESLFCGTNAVAAGDRAKEYLGNKASYCDPSDISSIEQAIIKEYQAARPSITSDMLSEYTWENAAKKSLNVYKRLVETK